MSRWTWEQPFVPAAELMVDRGASVTWQERERSQCLQEWDREFSRAFCWSCYWALTGRARSSPFQAEAMACLWTGLARLGLVLRVGFFHNVLGILKTVFLWPHCASVHKANCMWLVVLSYSSRSVLCSGAICRLLIQSWGWLWSSVVRQLPSTSKARDFAPCTASGADSGCACEASSRLTHFHFSQLSLS